MAALSVFVVLLIFYQQTVLRTAVDQDSGELVAAVHVQGIPHPTGYPLWLLLGGLFDNLPLGGTSAYRVGIMSAVGVAAAGAIITLVACSLTGEVLLAAFAGLAFGLWEPPWADLVRAMVHAISGLFVAIAILSLRRWNRERSPRALLWFSLAVGFAAMHHRTSFLVLAPAFLAVFFMTPPSCRGRYYAFGWFIWTGLVVFLASHVGMALAALLFVGMVGYAFSRRTCFRTYLGSVTLFLAPFSFYAYLWFRALAHPAVNWTDPTTLDRLIDHALARQYSHFAFSHTANQMVDYGIGLLPNLLAPGAAGVMLAIIGLPAIVWGLRVWWKREPVVAGSLAAGCVLLLIWVLQWGEASDLKHFLSPLGPPLALAGALGFADIRRSRSLAGAARAAPVGLAAVVCLILLAVNYPRCDFSNRWANRDRWAAELLQMAPNAVFLSDFDQPSFVTLYLQNVEKLRQDITLIRTVRLPAPFQPDQWYLDLIKDRELRDALREAWPKAMAGAPEIHEQTALLAYLLAERLPQRPIYAVHGLLRTRVPGPPYFVGLTEDLVRLDQREPNVPRDVPPVSPLAQLPAGLTLDSFKIAQSVGNAGEMLQFAVSWRLANPLPPTQFAVALVPPGMGPSRVLEVTDTEERLVQAFPVLYGQWGLGPSSPGAVYDQKGQLIVPTNIGPDKARVMLPAPARVFVAVAPLYTKDYQGWTEVGQLQIESRPRPRNGP